MRASLFASAAVVCVTCVSACDPPASSSSCGSDCAVNEPACDNGCPSIATEVCADDACVAVAAGVVDLAISVNLGRDLDDVAALAVAVIDVASAGASCDDVGAVKDADFVLAGNRFEVSGGAFHPDLRVGLVPEGAVLVAVDALDGQGAVVGSGCQAVDAAGSSGDVTVDVL